MKQSIPSMIIVVQKIIDRTTTVSCFPLEVGTKVILSRKLIVKGKWAGEIFLSASDSLRKIRSIRNSEGYIYNYIV